MSIIPCVMFLDWEIEIVIYSLNGGDLHLIVEYKIWGKDPLHL